MEPVHTKRNVGKEDTTGVTMEDMWLEKEPVNKMEAHAGCCLGGWEAPSPRIWGICRSPRSCPSATVQHTKCATLFSTLVWSQLSAECWTAIPFTQLCQTGAELSWQKERCDARSKRKFFQRHKQNTRCLSGRKTWDLFRFIHKNVFVQKWNKFRTSLTTERRSWWRWWTRLTNPSVKWVFNFFLNFSVVYLDWNTFGLTRNTFPPLNTSAFQKSAILSSDVCHQSCDPSESFCCVVTADLFVICLICEVTISWEVCLSYLGKEFVNLDFVFLNSTETKTNVAF